MNKSPGMDEALKRMLDEQDQAKQLCEINASLKQVVALLESQVRMQKIELNTQHGSTVPSNLSAYKAERPKNAIQSAIEYFEKHEALEERVDSRLKQMTYLKQDKRQRLPLPGNMKHGEYCKIVDPNIGDRLYRFSADEERWVLVDLEHQKIFDLCNDDTELGQVLMYILKKLP